MVQARDTSGSDYIENNAESEGEKHDQVRQDFVGKGRMKIRVQKDESEEGKQQQENLGEDQQQKTVFDQVWAHTSSLLSSTALPRMVLHQERLIRNSPATPGLPTAERALSYGTHSTWLFNVAHP
jgi:hypothetical protein